MSSVSQITVAPESKSAGRVVAQKSPVLKYWPLYLSIAPFYIIFLVFGLAPILFSLYLAFQKWDGVGAMTFTGWDNFYFALTDPVFGQAILNTFEIWIISTIPMLVIALVLAFALNMRTRSKFMYQVCYYLPYITATVAITLIFSSLFAEQFGLINVALTSMHLPSVQWLTDAWPMKWALALMVIWRWTGYNALIYTAGLQSIPADFYEAARIDGANTWGVFFYITLPLLRPVILFTVIASTLGGLTLFTEPFLLFTSSGGTGHEAMTMTLYQYGQAFSSFHYGYGAALGWVISIILLICTFINWNVVQRTER